MRVVRFLACLLVCLPSVGLAETRLEALLAERSAALTLRAEVAERSLAREIARYGTMVERALDPARDAWFEADRRGKAATHRTACRADDQGACRALATMYGTGDGTWADRDLAVAFKYDGCRAGHGPLCWALFYHRSDSNVRLQVPSPDHVYFERTCADGVGASCLVLADIVHHGYGDLEGDPALYEELRALACTLGEEKGCGERWGPRVSTEEMIGRCDAGEAGACRWVGRFAGDISPAEKLAYLARGCEAGSAEACKYQADALRTGSGADADPALALQRYERACDLSDYYCPDLGDRYIYGDIAPYDPDRAQAYYRRACAGRPSGGACDRVMRIGDEVMDPTDADLARHVPAPLLPRFDDAQSGCRDGDGASCHALGHLFHALRPERGKNEWRPEMKRAFDMACDLGDHRGCVTVAGKRRDAAARDLLRTACDAGVGDGCLALVRLDGRSDPAVAWAALEELCADGLTAACRSVGKGYAGYMPVFGAEIDESPETALTYLDPACGAGDGEACTAAGYALSRFANNMDEAAKARALARARASFERGCALDDAVACDRLAWDFLYPDEGRPDRTAAYPLAIKACALGGDCGAMHRLRLYAERDRLRAEHGPVASALLERYEDFQPWMRAGARRARLLCREGDLAGCVALGDIYDNSDTDGASLAYDSIDRDWANALYLHACEAGDGTGCARYGEQFRYNDWHDERVALDYSARACELGAPWGCYSAGTILDYGDADGVARDVVRAARYFGVGCELGLGDACEAAARLDGLDPATKAAFEQRACVHGDSLSCEFLGDDHRRTDPELAKAYYRIGCQDADADNRRTCSALSRMGG